MHALILAVTRRADATTQIDADIDLAPAPDADSDGHLDRARLAAALRRPAPDIVHVTVGPGTATSVTAVLYHRASGAIAARAGIRHVDEAIVAAGCATRWQRTAPPG